MDKKEALSIIFDAAERYERNLLNNNLLFVYKVENSLCAFETVFLKRNFLHLTGVQVDEKAIVSANSFFNICMSKRLRQDAFDFYPDGTTIKKLDVMKRLMEIHKNAQMIGYYDGSFLRLRTDRIVGDVFACLGFVFDEEAGCFIPNTALKVDCREVINGTPSQIQAVLRKSKSCNEYAEICSKRKGVLVEELNTINRVNIVV